MKLPVQEYIVNKTWPCCEPVRMSLDERGSHKLGLCQWKFSVHKLAMRLRIFVLIVAAVFLPFNQLWAKFLLHFATNSPALLTSAAVQLSKQYLIVFFSECPIILDKCYNCNKPKCVLEMKKTKGNNLTCIKHFELSCVWNMLYK